MKHWNLLTAGILMSMALVILLSLALIQAGCGAAPTPTPAPTASAVKAGVRIVAEGKVVPVRGVSLSFSVGGVIAQLPVALGERVDAGKLLARLDTKPAELELAQAEANLVSAQAKLAVAKRGPTPDELAAAQQSVTSAEAAYDNLLHPDPSDLVALKADLDKALSEVDRAQAAYDRIGGDSNPLATMSQEKINLQSATGTYQKASSAWQTKIKPTNSQIQQALSTVQTAKGQLAKLQPTPEDIAAAEANVSASQAARDLAAEKVNQSKLVAPFAGVVTALEPRAGEYAAAGTVVMRLADPSAWQVETTDLTELNIVNVGEGDAATLEFDAIPGLQLPGKVGQIKSYGENRQGDIVYTVVVKPDQLDARLRWNMTSKVSIAPKN